MMRAVAPVPNPMTAAGDLIVGGTNGAASRLPLGTAGKVLTSVGGAPAWATPAAPSMGLAGGAIQTAAYTWATGDLGNCLILNPASAISQVLPTPTGSSGNYANGWNASVENVSGNVVTLTVPAGLSLDGVSNGSAKLFPNTGCRFFTDGANWYTTRGLSNGGGAGLKAPGVLAQSAVPSSVTGTTSETTLATVAIPAGAIGPNGALHISLGYSQTSNANTKTIRFRINGTSIGGFGLTTQPTATFDFMLANRGVTNSQVCTLNNNNAVSWGLASGGTLNTTAIDTTQALSLTVTGQLGVSTDTLTLEMLCTRLENP